MLRRSFHTPEAAAAAAPTCKPSDLQNWRACGLLGGYGKSDGRTWHYTPAEVVCIAVAILLSRAGPSIREAFAIVEECRSEIDEIVAAEVNGQGLAADCVLEFDVDPWMASGFRAVRIDRSSAPIARGAVPMMLVANLSVTARNVLQSLRTPRRMVRSA